MFAVYMNNNNINTIFNTQDIPESGSNSLLGAFNFKIKVY